METGTWTWQRAALVGGLVVLGVVLVMNVPGVTDVRGYRSVAAVISHLGMSLIALGLSAHFRGWLERAAALTSGQRLEVFVAALALPMVVIVAGLLLFPSYGHELFTREWGLCEPAQFVLWLTAAWMSVVRARLAGRGTADSRAFHLAAFAFVLLALEEVDYLGVVSLVARLGGAPDGRINHHHIGGIHDVINDLGKASLALGLLALAVVVAAVLGWAVAQGLHRVVIREVFTVTSLPLVGTVLFLGISQLADIDHPIVTSLFGQSAFARRMREEPMELLATICANAALVAKLVPWLTPRMAPPALTDRSSHV